MPLPATISTANLITLARIPLLLVVVILLYTPWSLTLFTALGLLPILFLMDWLDGYVARQKNQASDLGGVLDIAIDRAVENVLWIVFAHQGRVPVFIPILFILRSFVVDGLRNFALTRGRSAFGMMHSPWGRFLVAGRLMRGLYGLAKWAAFCALAFNSGLVALEPAQAAHRGWTWVVEAGLVYLATALCLARGVPVLLDIRALLDQAPREEGSR